MLPDSELGKAGDMGKAKAQERGHDTWEWVLA